MAWFDCFGAAYPALDKGIQCWGDSLTQATSDVNVVTQAYPVQLSNLFSPVRTINNKGIGGETAAQIATRQTGYVAINTQINVIWAGRNGVLTLTPANIVASIQSMVTHVGDSRFAVLSVINKTDGTEDPGSDNYALIVALNTLMQQTWPNNYISVIGLVASPSTRVDGLHLTAAGYGLIAAAVHAFAVANSW